MNFKRLSGRSVLVLAAFFISACGSGGSDEEQLANVDDLLFDRETVALTDQITLKADISYSEETVFNADQDVVVLLRVSPGIEYVFDTARIDKDGYSSDIRALEERCSNGDRYLRFRIDRGDLTSYDDGLSSSARMLFTMRGAVVGPAFVEARAQYNEVVGSCASGIRPDAAAPIVVTALRVD